MLVSKLDTLSRLAGFDPASATDNWHALPTHTLRFAEVLAKLTASRFTIAETLYLFTIDGSGDCDRIFRLPGELEALHRPLDLPDDDGEFSLSRLRHKLLVATENPFCSDAEWNILVETKKAARDERRGEVERLEIRVSQDGHDEWHWKRVASVLEEELGFASSDVLDFARHFFPHILEHAGYHVDNSSSRFASALPAAKTTPAKWTVPGEGPFQYDPSADQLWVRLPMSDHAVIGQLTRLSALNADEENAVQDLYFQPRAMLALFAMLFPDLAEAITHLVEERESRERWDYFRRHVALCHRRCCIIARHLSHHVAAVTGQECPEGEAPALLVLRQLLGDENKATASWEMDDGSEPPLTWTPPPNGGALAALLGLLGTGLVAEYKVSGSVVWRDVSGSLDGFGIARDRENAPVPTVVPAIGAAITPALSKFASVNNGFLLNDAGGALLGGAQGFDVTWSGALLIDEEGPYEFWGGSPGFDCDKPHCDDTDRSKWRMTLHRGSKTWVLLSHLWPGEEDRRSASQHMKRGAYGLTIELSRPNPDFPSQDKVHHLRAGLQVLYSGPDSDCERIPIPHRHLFSAAKDKTLGDGIASASAGAASYLGRCYTSTFRDIRRTYQRAFKALLLVHRFALSAHRSCQATSELGYMLEEKERFAGVSYFRSGGGFLRHAAYFDFNFLPLVDDYQSPTTDSRTDPSAKRVQAIFDWWERLFDYTATRDDIRLRHDRQLWHLFAEARAAKPSDPASLLGQIEPVDRFWRLCLRYYQAQAAPVYPLTSDDLEDDRWGVRVWHADRWLHALVCNFASRDLTVARPDLWASADPGALVSGEAQTGTANLSAFLVDGCLESGEPRRYHELKRLNDSLRERGRAALLDYLCHLDRVPLPWMPGKFASAPRDLSELLLFDVEAGICETASRIDVVIAAVQSCVRLARLHRDPAWPVTPQFAHMWDREFATFHVWQACKRRLLYKENGIEWSDLEKAQRVEAFRLLEDSLRSFTLSVAVPGSAQWWPDQRPPSPHHPRPLQSREPSSMQLLSPPREGLNLLGNQERAARPSWLAAVRTGGGPPPAIIPSGKKQLPMWMEAAVGLGTRFIRVDAAGLPPASSLFEKCKQKGPEDCVCCCDECGCSHPVLVDEYYFWLIPAQVYGPPPLATLTGAPSASASSSDYQNGYQNDYYDNTQKQSAVWHDVETQRAGE